MFSLELLIWCYVKKEVNVVRCGKLFRGFQSWCQDTLELIMGCKIPAGDFQFPLMPYF